jgi:RNA polymerase sigma factor (sigma-70 family)
LPIYAPGAILSQIPSGSAILHLLKFGEDHVNYGQDSISEGKVYRDVTRVSVLIRVKTTDNPRDWEEFTSIYRPLLMHYARTCGLKSHDAEDIAQDCLVRIHQSIKGFEYDKSHGGFKNWLRVMVQHLVINQWRKRKEILAGSGVFKVAEGDFPLPEDELGRLWEEEIMDFCLEKLQEQANPRNYAVFWRQTHEGWSVERVCQEYGISANNAYVIKSRLTEELRGIKNEFFGESD